MRSKNKGRFPCGSQLQTILGLARKGLRSVDVTICTSMEKEHVRRAFARLEEWMRRRGVPVEPTIFPDTPPRQGWRLPHGKRFLDKAGVGHD